jgi:RimJ/RimL family protein N-acetyltransferase
MTSPTVLQHDGIVLREFRLDDADDTAAGASDPLTQRFVPSMPSPYARPEALHWITVGAPAAIARGGAAFAIADPGSDRLLGGVGLRADTEGTAEVGYWVAPWARGRGVATAAAVAISRYGFDHGFERLALRTELENSASQRVAIAAGFTREGVQRGGGANRGGDGRHDLIAWARLITDPSGPTHRLLPDLPGRGDDAEGNLSDGVVILRPLGPGDIEDTFALRSLPDVVATSVPPEVRDHDRIARACTRSQAGWLAGERADLTIRDAATGAYAGEIGLYYQEPPTGQAMIGYSLLPRWRGLGYTTRAARLVTHWAFEQVGILRVIAGTEPGNTSSQRVLERAGFVREGYQRSRLPGPNGTRIDDILYARLP